MQCRFSNFMNSTRVRIFTENVAASSYPRYVPWQAGRVAGSNKNSQMQFALEQIL